MPKFVEDHDANRMLQSSIISLGGRLIYVQQVINKELYGSDIETGEQIKTAADFDLIKNPSEGRLGYHNSAGGCAYIVRMPARITTMGLCRSNLKAIAAHSGAGRRATTEFVAPLFKSIYNTYHDIFPSFEQAYTRTMDKGLPTAFDRSFAITAQGDLMFRGKAIGKANARGEEYSVLNAGGKAIMSVRNIPKLKWR